MSSHLPIKGGPWVQTSASTSRRALSKTAANRVTAVFRKKTAAASVASRAAVLSRAFDKIAQHLGDGVRDLGHSHRFGYGLAYTGNPCGHGGPTVPTDQVRIRNFLSIEQASFRRVDPSRGWNGFPSSIGSLAALLQQRQPQVRQA